MIIVESNSATTITTTSRGKTITTAERDTTITTNYNDGGTILFYFIGESNSGGKGFNSSASASEITPKPKVQILNNSSLVFEDLHIDGIVATGKNNYIGHTDIDEDNPWHGWELQLAQRVQELDPKIYLIKAGQGGSSLDDWGVGSAFFNTFVARSDAAKSILDGVGKTPKVYVFISIGLSDMLDGNSTSTFETELTAWLNRIQSQVESTQMFITSFESMAGWTQYDQTIIDVADSLSYLTRIDTTGASLVDPRHWDYSGVKQICNDMVDLI